MRRARTLVKTALIAAGAFLLAVTYTPLARWATLPLCGRWEADDGDVLILLTGSEISHSTFPNGALIGLNTYWRTVHAISMWRAGHFRTLLVCGQGGADAVKPLLETYGVPAGSIIVENNSTNTRENALFAKPILDRLSGKFVLLTSDYHMYRARRCFARQNIRVTTIPAPDALKRVAAPLLRWEVFWTVAEEYLKVAYYRIHGWI